MEVIRREPVADRPCEHLRHHRHVRIHRLEGAALVSVELRPEEDELAVLPKASKRRPIRLAA